MKLHLSPVSIFSSRKPDKIFSDQWEDRSKILDPGNNLFCWTRQLPNSICSYMEDILQLGPDPAKRFVDKENLHSQVQQIRKEWEADAKVSCAPFWEDVERISNDFLDFSENKSGTLHLRMVDNDACSKFHTDGYRLRLFVTYHGDGTEWLPEAYVNRQGLGKSNADIVKDPQQIQKIGTGHVSILKGEIPGRFNFIRGIVHRSPPVDNGERRIILRVDLN